MRKKILVTAALIVFFAGASHSQTPIPNGDFEEWTSHPGQGLFKEYEEPSGVWSSGNGVVHVAPGSDPVCEKTEDAVSGTYAVKLTTRQIFGQMASGSLYTGRFELNLQNPRESARLGMPYTDRPLRFKGYYKYFPAGGDSGVVRTALRKWDGQESKIIGQAIVGIYSEVPEWTSFDVAVTYFSQETPDTVEVVFASSKGGGDFRGDVGSTLFVDAVEFTNDAVSVQEEDRSTPVVWWNESEGRIVFAGSPMNESYTISDVDGRIVQSGVLTGRSVDLGFLSKGVYIFSTGNMVLKFMR